MKLSEQWDDRTDRIVSRMIIGCAELEPQFTKSIPSGAILSTATDIYENLSALLGATYQMCMSTKTNAQIRVSSQFAAIMLRSLIEGLVSTIVFCEDPKEAARDYQDSLAVSQYQFAIDQVEALSLGSPFGRSTEEILALKQEALDRLRDGGGSVLEWVGKAKVGQRGLGPEDRLQDILGGVD
jgi:hypothetical protein